MEFKVGDKVKFVKDNSGTTLYEKYLNKEYIVESFRDSSTLYLTGIVKKYENGDRFYFEEDELELVKEEPIKQTKKYIILNKETGIIEGAENYGEGYEFESLDDVRAYLYEINNLNITILEVNKIFEIELDLKEIK